jgi:hypothetical protein
VPQLGSPLKRPRDGSIPQGIPVLDSTDSINQGSLGCWLPGRLLGYGLTGLNPKGTFNGGPHFAPSPLGLSLSLSSASSQYLSVTLGGGLNNLQTGSISLWANWVGTSQQAGYSSVQYGLLCGRQGGYSNQLIGLNGANPNTAKIAVCLYGYSTINTTSTGSPGVGVWTHIVYTYKSGAQSLYINGALNATSTGTGSIANSPDPLGIGAWIGYSYLNGLIDIFRTFNRILLPGEVARLYTDPFAGLLFPSDRMWSYAALGGGGPTIISVSALGAAIAAGRALPAANSNVFARGTATAALRAAASSSAQIQARAAALAAARPSVDVTTSIAARSSALNAGRTSAGAAASIAARSAALVAAQSALGGLTTVTARILAMAAGRVTTSTSASILASGRTAAISMGRMAMGGAVNVAGRLAGIVSGRAAQGGQASILARTISLSTDRAAITAETSVSIRSNAMNRGQGAMIGATEVSARALNISTGRGILSGITSVISISARAAAIVAGWAGIKIFSLVADKPYARLAPSWFYTALSPAFLYTATVRGGQNLPKLRDLPAVAPSQVQTCALDFGFVPLPPGVILTGTPVLTLSVKIGTDTIPQSRITNGPFIGTQPVVLGGSGITNNAIIFQIGNCQPWVTYIIEGKCSLTDGDMIEGWCYFQCVPPN